MYYYALVDQKSLSQQNRPLSIKQIEQGKDNIPVEEAKEVDPGRSSQVRPTEQAENENQNVFGKQVRQTNTGACGANKQAKPSKRDPSIAHEPDKRARWPVSLQPSQTASQPTNRQASERTSSQAKQASTNPRATAI